MIASLHGKLFEKNPRAIIVDVTGVGYEVIVPLSTYSLLPEEGGVVDLRIYTQVREDAIALFGFHSRQEKEVFEKLISITGIGPKLAVTVLSGLAVNELISAIRDGEAARLTRIPGVGKKTAERMVLELKDKFDHFGLAQPATGGQPSSPPLSQIESDTISALMNQGLAKPAAEAAVRKAAAAGAGTDVVALFRRALELAR